MRQATEGNNDSEDIDQSVAPMPVAWKTIHIFISSTFDDMHAERDYLVKRVFPELNDWCERRSLRVVDVDLRWGVTEQDAAYNKSVARVCLTRIDDCRPFFLCFLGQRRGRVPSVEEFSPDVFSAFPELHTVAGHASITEMEILHALVSPFNAKGAGDAVSIGSRSEVARHSFFYLREPSYLRAMPTDPPALRRIYTNECIENLSERAEHDRALREWRETRIPNLKRPYHTYSATWDDGASTPEVMWPLECPATEPASIERWRTQWRQVGVAVSGLDVRCQPVEAERAAEFNRSISAGRLGDFMSEGAPLHRVIIRELQEAINACHPAHSGEEEGDELARELRQQEQALFVNCEGFVRRRESFNELDNYAENESRAPFVLTGESGSGKTMLLANWIDRYRKREDLSARDSIHFRFIGTSDGSGTVYTLIRSLLREIKDIGKIDGPVPDDPIDLAQKWREALVAMGPDGTTIIVIDALNQLGTSPADMDWVPRMLPANVKFIVSFRQDGAPDAVALLGSLQDAGARIWQVPPFSDLDDRRQLVSNQLSQYLKELDQRHIETLIRAEGASNPLYLKIALSELRVFGAFGSLETKIRHDFGDTTVSAFEGVLTRLAGDPTHTTIESRSVVSTVFGLMACARRGLAANDLAALLIQVLGLPDDDVSRGTALDAVHVLVRQTRPYLARREGRYDFLYETFRMAVRKTYVESSGDNKSGLDAWEWHAHLARHFRRKADPSNDGTWRGEDRMALTELAYHLLEGRLYEDLFALADDELFLQTQAKQFPDNPHLILDTLQASMKGASRIDDGPKLAHLVLRHASKVVSAREETPLQALRAGNLDRALLLADLYEAKTCALQLLLLAWELRDSGQAGKARAVLHRLSQMTLPHVQQGEIEIAADLLTHSSDIDNELFDRVCEKLCKDDDALLGVARRLTDQGRFSAALRIGSRLESDLWRTGMLQQLARAQIANKAKDARVTLGLALESAMQLGVGRDEFETSRSIGQQVDAMREIALGWWSISEADGARRILTMASARAVHIRSAEIRTEMQRTLAFAQWQLGMRGRAQDNIAAALRSASEIDDIAKMAKELHKIATLIVELECEAGLNVVAIATRLIERLVPRDSHILERPLAPAADDRFFCALALISLAQTTSKLGRVEDSKTAFQGALSVAESIRDDVQRISLVQDVATAQASEGQFDAAIASAQRIRTARGKAQGLHNVALSQVSTRRQDLALETGGRIKNEYWRVLALVEIARGFARLGHATESRATLSAAIPNARRIKEASEKNQAWRNLALAFAESGSSAEAWDCAGRIEDAKDMGTTQAEVCVWTAKAADFDSALRFARKIQDAALRAGVLRQIALAQYARNAVSAGRRTFEYALAAARSTGGSTQSLLLREIALAQAEVGEGRNARTTMAQAISGVPRDGDAETEGRSVALRNIASRQALAGEVVAAEATFAESLDAALRIEDFKTHDEAIQAIALCQAKVGQNASAVETARRVAWSRTKALVDLGVFQATAEGFEAARTAFAAAFGTVGAIKPALRTHAYKEIAQGYVQLKQFAAASEAAQWMDNLRERAGILLTMAEAQAREGMVGAATLTSMRIAGIALSLRLRSFLLGRRGWLDKENSRYVMSLRASARKSIAVQLARQGRFDRALKIAPDSEYLLARIAVTLAGHGKFTSALEYAALVRYAPQKLEMLAEIAIAQCRAGEIDDGQRTFAWALEVVRGLSETFQERAKKLTLIAIAQVRCELFEAGRATFAEALNAGSAARRDVVAAQIQVGEIAMALNSAGLIEDAGARAETYCAIASAQAEAGATAAAEASFALALEAARRCGDEVARSKAIGGIGVAEALAGRGEVLQQRASSVLVARDEWLPRLAAAACTSGFARGLTDLAVPCAYYPGAAYQICGLLPQLYPEQLMEIARVVSGNGSQRR